MADKRAIIDGEDRLHRVIVCDVRAASLGVRPGLGSHRRCRGRGSVLRVLRTRMLSNRSC